MSQDHSVTVRFHPPPECLRGCFTSFYVTEIDPGSSPQLHDSLHPEWAGMRFHSLSSPEAWNDLGQSVSGSRFIFSGPSSRPVHFAISRTRMWGIGLLPLGWARFMRQPAADYANSILDGFSTPVCTPFRPLAQLLTDPDASEADQLLGLADFFQAFDAPPTADEGRILAIHGALVDPDVVTVIDLVNRVSASQRTVERLCDRHFGFSPKLLLRRQRLMRSLAQFMLDPSLNWIGAMDSNYHDQAQFVRDFREFMGLAPGEYAAQSHPILDQFVRERNRVQGSAVQTMDQPNFPLAGFDAKI